MGAVVVYDACVLHPAPLRDLLLRLARTGLFRARWTDEILDECFGSILRERPDLNPQKLALTRRLMIDAVPDCLVRNFSGITARLELPDDADRHVLAAAIRSGAQTIVTSNLRDFPPAQLAKYDVRAQHPDEFLLGLLRADPEIVHRVLADQSDGLRAPAMTVEEVLERLEATGVKRFVAEVRRIRVG